MAFSERRLFTAWGGREGRGEGVLAAALNTGFGYMLRAGEFLYRDGRGWDFAKVARGGDVEVKGSDGKRTCTYHWRSSKADQLASGIA